MADPKGMGASNAVNSDLSDLQGARYVFTSKIKKSQRLSLGRVKYLTGLSTIKTRRMRRELGKLSTDAQDLYGLQ